MVFVAVVTEIGFWLLIYYSCKIRIKYCPYSFFI
jgi:hypothetical protein